MPDIDHSAFEAAYQAALPGHLETMAAKSADKSAKLGLMGMDDLQNIEASFCTSWPKIRGFLNMAIGMAGWLPQVAGIAAQAKAVLTAMDKTIVPSLCGTSQTTPPVTPKPPTGRQA